MVVLVSMAVLNGGVGSGGGGGRMTVVVTEYVLWSSTVHWMGKSVKILQLWNMSIVFAVWSLVFIYTVCVSVFVCLIVSVC